MSDREDEELLEAIRAIHRARLAEEARRLERLAMTEAESDELVSRVLAQLDGGKNR